MVLPQWATTVLEFMVLANAANTVGFCFVRKNWHLTLSLCFHLSGAGESRPPTALCCGSATAALKSLLCSGTDRRKKGGRRAFRASLSTTQLEDMQDTHWAWNLLSLKITRCLIFSLSIGRLRLVLFVQIETPLKTRLEIQR